MSQSEIPKNQNTESEEIDPLDKYPIGTEVEYELVKMTREGQLVKFFFGEEFKVTGEGTIHGFQEGRYIIRLGENYFPVSAKNIKKRGGTEIKQ